MTLLTVNSGSADDVSIGLARRSGTSISRTGNRDNGADVNLLVSVKALFSVELPAALGIIRLVFDGIWTARVRPVRFLTLTLRILHPDGSELLLVFTSKVLEAIVTVPTYLRVTNCCLAELSVFPDIET